VISAKHEKRQSHIDTVQLEFETTDGVTTVEGAVVLEKPRLLRIDGIYVESMLDGNLIFMKNDDVPGVIGFVGTMLGQHQTNIANFSLGRSDAPNPGGKHTAIALVEVDGEVPEKVLEELRRHPAVKIARTVSF
jgi:D-3-phosphoglycerate dehydrogenase